MGTVIGVVVALIIAAVIVSLAIAAQSVARGNVIREVVRLISSDHEGIGTLTDTWFTKRVLRSLSIKIVQAQRTAWQVQVHSGPMWEPVLASTWHVEENVLTHGAVLRQRLDALIERLSFEPKTVWTDGRHGTNYPGP
jgi:hypothetical protein